MKQTKILMADSQMGVIEQLARLLRNEEQMEVVGIADNGKTAYEIFEEEKPDIVIFDLFLSIYDGYTLLEKIRETDKEKNTRLIMTTPVSQDFIIREAFDRGVDYMITKPYDVDSVVKKLRMISCKLKEANIKREEYMAINAKEYQENKRIKECQRVDMVISQQLNEIGMPARLKGYRYMITAVKSVLDNEESLEAITKVLYPEVAKKHNSTPQRVEKAIRHAIEVTWNDNDPKQLKTSFGPYVGMGKARPTNREFLAQFSLHIKQGVG